MEKEGVVSLWIGNMESDSELSEYVDLVYTDDEDELKPSKFLEHFQIDVDDFDEDFIEVIYLQKRVTSITELISGCSYEETITSKFEELFKLISLKEVNVGILLYNFEYNGCVMNSSNGLKFVGAVKYI